MISNQLINLIKRFEGLSLKAYTDTNGIWTIGYGDTLNVRPGMIITEEQAEDRLKASLQSVEKNYSRLVSAELNANQRDAIMDFIYNCGPFNFETSHLRAYTNDKEFDKAANEFTKWVHDRKGNTLPGLLKRRQAEQELFQCPETSEQSTSN